jgi:ribosomal protein S18 acetylase RimI-like enzyme
VSRQATPRWIGSPGGSAAHHERLWLRGYPSRIDANPYAFLDYLGLAPAVGRSVTAALSRLGSALPVPLLRSTYRLRCADTATLRTAVAAVGPGDGPWWVGPSATPGAGAMLAEWELRLVDELPLMSAQLASLPPGLPAPDGVAVERVRSANDLRAWAAAYAGAHGYPPDVERAWCGVLASLGLDGASPLRHYVARRGGEPIASATVFLGTGVAGLYCVATPPAWRGQGLGTAVTLHALGDARTAGYDVAVLGAEAPAVNLYRRLGFRPGGVMRVYAP